MAEVRCAGGRVLDVRPVPVLDRRGEPYEATLRLLLDGEPFGEVGERCAWFLADAAEQVRAAADAGAAPQDLLERGVRAWAAGDGADPDRAWAGLSHHLPRDRELFCFRSRDPDDTGGEGVLRAVLRPQRAFEQGRWRSEVRVALEAWGEDGTGVSASLTLLALAGLLEALVAEVDRAAAGAAAAAGGG